MDVICIETTAFQALIEKVIEQVYQRKPPAPDKWISTIEAMELLRNKSATTLHKFREEGKYAHRSRGNELSSMTAILSSTCLRILFRVC